MAAAESSAQPTRACRRTRLRGAHGCAPSAAWPQGVLMSNRFLSKLEALLDAGRPPLCVGLDPDPARLPHRYADLLDWNRAIIRSTADIVACYKPNIAFYEALGSRGYEVLQQTLALIPDEIPVILDAKRGDIGSTAAAYARACFEVWDVDAVTLSPYLGGDSVRPFTDYGDRYVFVLCHTSNPGAAELQGLSSRGRPLYRHLAAMAAGWGRGNVGLVVGATYPRALAEVRAEAPDAWFLVPGVGAQGGDATQALRAGCRQDGRGVLVNVSRGVALAEDHREAALAYGRQLLTPPAATTPGEVSPLLRELALRLHRLDCIRFGDFTLASGLHSPVYVDLRLLVSDAQTLGLAARVYAQLLDRVRADRIAGVPYAALPIATAVSLETSLPLIYPRKEVKQYGRAQAIEGAFEPGERVVVIEDLVTTAGSLIRSIETLREAGLEVTDAAVLIDREQGGVENLARAGVRLHAAYRFSTLLALLHEAGHLDAGQYRRVLSYLQAQE
ncbi:MAG: orotidine-5'-phosphate decarboxylase [Caldilineae bacterium]|nr:MAG: orotidine-5'-phosphate decarboxylase [Caldilineae bacterium]